ncbi:hypothetical protein TPHV1_20012 [Treponema phagedenis]|uniref:Uncharacterized protein n=1 Tax=Treponema phagedenis TaxID=162 RepID=A0A0B7GX07_TREPH|nr:hypothetical protein TPHV1_20012 [Treponema phagedenis]
MYSNEAKNYEYLKPEWSRNISLTEER